MNKSNITKRLEDLEATHNSDSPLIYFIDVCNNVESQPYVFDGNGEKMYISEDELDAACSATIPNICIHFLDRISAGLPELENNDV